MELKICTAVNKQFNVENPLLVEHFSNGKPLVFQIYVSPWGIKFESLFRKIYCEMKAGQQVLPVFPTWLFPANNWEILGLFGDNRNLCTTTRS